MAAGAFGLLAALFVALSEGFARTRFRLSVWFLVVALSLLITGFRRSYLIIGIILVVITGIAAALYRLPSEMREGRGVRGRVLGQVAPNALAGLFHLVGVWVLPFCAVWGWSGSYSDPEFFSQEIGHLVPATFYFLALVLFPLLIMPRGFEKGDLEHQLYEGSFNFAFSVVYFLIFRMAHWSEGQSPPKMSAPNWDHEFLGCIWAASGAMGVLAARHGYKTSIHIAFPAAFICFTMLTHSSTHHEEIASMEGWKMAWMKLHRIHGICFGVGALCRLLYRLPEAVFFFFLGSFDFVFSAKWVIRAMNDALDYKEDPESGWDPTCAPNCDVHYPTDHVASLLVVTMGAILFPIHLASLGQLRLFLEQISGHAFSVLPTTDDEPDGEHGMAEPLSKDLTVEKENDQERVVLALREV